MSHAYLVSGGSEAVESALKMARQYFVEIGQPQRTHFIARRQSYHGNTLGALAVGGNAWRRAPFAPILVPATHVAPCYPYREQRADESPEAYGLRLAAELDAAIVAQGADRVIAFVAERWAAPRPACSRPCRATSRPCAKCATATACC
jgi:adenosylmethionine-8-amino-7-oxononanoate aminotransferase